MKKKPAPGATLIARLKEQRLAREAELARRQGSPTELASAAPAQVKGDDDDIENAQPAAAKEPEKAVAKPAASDIVKAPQDKADMRTVRAGDATIVVETNEAQQVVLSSRPARDLIHRTIDFDDLKPTSNDYFVLTDEIRLAGRFAAVGLIAQGLRLYRIREADIYKNHYQTFEEYCRKEHHMSATYAYRLMRMAEMAEQVARIGQPVSTHSENMPDPFEVMIGLGHRHLMALLPLELPAAQELLVKGIPISESERLPIAKATEKQIRQALQGLGSSPSKGAVRVTPKRALADEKQLIPALSKLVEMLEDWSLWLGGDPPEELQAARMGRGPLLNRLAKRFRAACNKIADALETPEDQ